MRPEEQEVLAAAQEWAMERSPKDPSSKRLAVAVARAWPENWQTKEVCTCGEQDDCDECLTHAQVEALVSSMERELAQGLAEYPPAAQEHAPRVIAARTCWIREQIDG